MAASRDAEKEFGSSSRVISNVLANFAYPGVWHLEASGTVLACCVQHKTDVLRLACWVKLAIFQNSAASSEYPRTGS